MKLTDIILEDQAHYRKLADKLEKELRDTYDRDDIHVTMGAYSGGRSADDPLKDKGFGKVSIHSYEDLPDGEYRNMKSVLTARGYEITGGANYFDTDDDRYYFPDIKFNFSL